METTDFKKVINAAELVKLQWRPHGWLLWQVVPQGGITLLAGETASGKSLLGLDLALSLAAGRGRAWDMELGAPSLCREPLHRAGRTPAACLCRERTPAVPHEANMVPYIAERTTNDAHLNHRYAVPTCPDLSQVPQGGRLNEAKTLREAAKTPAACPGSEAERVPHEVNKKKIAVSSWLMADREKIKDF